MESSENALIDNATLRELFAVDEVDFIGSKDSRAADALRQALASLRESIQDERSIQGCRRLLKIVENVLLHPWDHEKRRIRESNAVYLRDVASNPQILAVLEALGFRSVNGHAVLQVVDVPRLRDAYRTLIAALRDDCGVHVKSLEGHFFDPFKAYRHHSDVSKNTDTDDFECHGTDTTKRQVEALTSRMSEPVSTGLHEWKPQIYFEGVGCGQPSAASEHDSPEEKPSAAQVMKIYNVGKTGDFESASRKKLETLKRQWEYMERMKTVELKIKLPASTVLIIHPPMRTQVAKLKRELQSILVDAVAPQDWELVEMPTRRALDEGKTLIQQDVTHKVVLHFRYKGRWPVDITHELQPVVGALLGLVGGILVEALDHEALAGVRHSLAQKVVDLVQGVHVLATGKVQQVLLLVHSGLQRAAALRQRLGDEGLAVEVEHVEGVHAHGNGNVLHGHALALAGGQLLEGHDLAVLGVVGNHLAVENAVDHVGLHAYAEALHDVGVLPAEVFHVAAEQLDGAVPQEVQLDALAIVLVLAREGDALPANGLEDFRGLGHGLRQHGAHGDPWPDLAVLQQLLAVVAVQQVANHRLHAGQVSRRRFHRLLHLVDRVHLADARSPYVADRSLAVPGRLGQIRGVGY
ncbi:uncharacterized protein BcabD6B2_45880 [Babesia caballi]|uniref:PUB domain-containing protein n=1 Tax=Babesia caballi TaxID=5871 RepID=A0AAV4LYV0_BABCB|nr:hypothetical protein, conserved [Babesia caballi]